MRKLKFAASVILAATCALIFQGGTTSSGQETHAVSSSTETRPDGHIVLSVLNNSNSPITAVAAVGTRTVLGNSTTDTSVRFFDSVLNPFGPKEVMEGHTYAFDFFGPNPPPDQLRRGVEIKAVLFADGLSWGDPKWVDTLLLRRSSALKYNEEALQAIEAASAGGSTRGELASLLGRLRSQEVNTAQTIPEKQAADVAFAEAVLMLRDTTEADGTEVPLAESIAHARSRLLLRIDRLKAAKPAAGE